MPRYVVPPLPIDVSGIESAGFAVPEEIKVETGCRELLAMLQDYARVGLEELRAQNPERHSAEGTAAVDEINAPIPEQFRKMLALS